MLPLWPGRYHIKRVIARFNKIIKIIPHCLTNVSLFCHWGQLLPKYLLDGRGHEREQGPEQVALAGVPQQEAVVLCVGRQVAQGRAAVELHPGVGAVEQARQHRHRPHPAQHPPGPHWGRGRDETERQRDRETETQRQRETKMIVEEWVLGNKNLATRFTQHSTWVTSQYNVMYCDCVYLMLRIVGRFG